MNEIYRRQIAPQDATATLPFARPETFGAGAAAAVGDAAAQVSQQLIANRRLETALERDKQASAAALMFATIQEEANEYFINQQGEAGLGGKGYTRQIEAWLQDRESQFLQSIGDDQVRQVMAGRFADFRTRSVSSARTWEAGQSIGLAVENYGEVTKIRANRAGRSNPDQFVSLLGEQEQDVAMLENVPANVKQKLLRAGIEQLSVGFIEGQPPAERKALLESGLFDAVDPDVIRRLKNGAEVDLRREQQEIEARMRAAKAEAKQRIGDTLEELKLGIPLDDARIAEMQTLAEENGLESEAKQVFDARIVNQANREFENIGFVGIDAEVKRLNSKIAKDGRSARRADIVRRDHLAGLRDTRKTMIENDPAEFASRLGIEWAPIDFTDGAGLPAAVAARRRAATATAGAAGMPVKFLTEAESDQLAANIGTRDGKSVLLEVARQFGPDAGKVIDQVAPGQPLLKHVVGLAPKYRGYALDGAGLLENKGYKAPSDLDAVIRARIGGAMNGFDENARRGVIETTRGLYAYYQAKRGDDGERVDERLVSILVDRALGNGDDKRGEEGGRGGIAMWRGKQGFVLPARMTADDFNRRINGIGNLKGFFWGDGETPITPQQLRDRFVPVAIGGGRYVWAGANGTFALNKQGGRAVMDVSKIADPGEAQRARQDPERGNLLSR